MTQKTKLAPLVYFDCTKLGVRQSTASCIKGYTNGLGGCKSCKGYEAMGYRVLTEEEQAEYLAEVQQQLSPPEVVKAHQLIQRKHYMRP